MKTIAAAALICLLVALALPLLLAPSGQQEASPSPAGPSADAETEFTVLTGGEVLTVTMADWLPGVVAGEMPALFEPEALEAQAIAARSYILSRTRTINASHPQADVCDDPSCCKAHSDEAALRASWGDKYDEYWAKMLSAVRETDGHDIPALVEALSAAKADRGGKPHAIVARTVKGKGVSFMEGQAGWHGKAPNAEQLAAALADLGAAEKKGE